MRTFTLRKSTVAKAAGLLMLSSAAVLGVTGNASAAGIYTAYTTDSGATGGHASFNTGTDVLTVCDTQADGLRAYGSIGFWDSSGNWEGWSKDAAGGSGTCATVQAISIVPGIKIQVAACLKNGADGALQYCETINGTT